MEGHFKLGLQSIQAQRTANENRNKAKKKTYDKILII